MQWHFVIICWPHRTSKYEKTKRSRRLRSNKEDGWAEREKAIKKKTAKSNHERESSSHYELTDHDLIKRALEACKSY